MMAKSFSPDEISTFKVCTKCNISKPLSCYYRNAIQPDGHEKVCIDCRNLRNNTYLPTPATEPETTPEKLVKKVVKKKDQKKTAEPSTESPKKKPAAKKTK